MARHARGHADRERGAALVEAAIAVPLLFLLLFGIIDFGSVYNDWISVRQGARDGVRQAAVGTQPSNGNWTNANCPTTGLSTVASNGTLTATTGAASPDGYDLICYVKQRVGLNLANTRVAVMFVPQSPAPTFAAGQGVIVCVQYPAKSISGYLNPFFANKTLTTKVEIRIEQNSVGTFPLPVEETPLNGSWGSNCAASAVN